MLFISYSLFTFIICSMLTSDYRAERFTSEAEVLKVIKCAGAVRGITQLDTELFVCTWDSSERVAVYDLNTYTVTRHVTVSGMEYPYSLAACKQNNCLYIGDCGLACIHRVDLSDDTCSKWSVKATPYGVSLTRAFNLLVTLPQSIEEYTTTGSLIRSITLDASIDSPQHAIELSSGQFVVCHEGSAQHRVCVVDTTGRIVHSYGGPPGSSTGQLYGPRSLAVDTRGYVFVADSYNNRVQLLSPTLTHLGDVTTPRHQLGYPYALHLDELNGRLYVGGLSPRVLVLSVNKRSH